MIDPGWYNDELDPSLARWHDGTGWTSHVMRKSDWAGPGSPPPPVEARSVLTGAAGPPAAPPRQEAPRPVPLMEAPPRPSRSRRSQFERPSGHLIAAIVSLVVILVSLLALQQVEEQRDADALEAANTTSTTLPGYSAEWTAQGGGTYRVTATPSLDVLDQASRYGCLDKPTVGHVNALFTVVIENTSADQEAPVPQLAFGANLRDGFLDPAITTLDGGGSTDIEVGPIEEGASCSLARSIAAGQGTPIPPGGSATFTGAVGEVPSPFPAGLALIVRYFQADDYARGPGFVALDLLAPFPADPTSTSTSG